jgi:pimeloyl-ACP methyl ester carboxylesterase
MLPFLRDAGAAYCVDLPPVEVRRPETRHLNPESLSTLTVDDWASALLADLDAHGLERAVLVGHSMGGLTISEVAARAPERVAHLVYVAAAVPPEGGSILDTLPAEIAEMSRASIAAVRPGSAIGGLPPDLVRAMFCSDLDEAQTQFVLDHVGPEVLGIVGEPVSRAAMPPSLPKTYVKTLRDATLPPEHQDELIANLAASPGGVLDVVEVDSGHDVMIGAPDRLAAVLDAIVDAAAGAST